MCLTNLPAVKTKKKRMSGKALLDYAGIQGGRGSALSFLLRRRPRESRNNKVENRVVIYTMPCGSAIPHGGACTCNCVPGRHAEPVASSPLPREKRRYTPEEVRSLYLARPRLCHQVTLAPAIVFLGDELGALISVLLVKSGRNTRPVHIAGTPLGSRIANSGSECLAT